MKETKSLEFKSTITNTFLKTVSAYSNFGDGEVWFGVNDDGTVCGVPDIEQVLEGSNLSFEEIAYGEKDLAFEELSKKLIEKLELSAVSEDVLRTLGLFTRDKKFNNAAALLSDKNDYFGIDMARFGNSINEIMDREMVSGTSILRQYDAAVSMIKRYYQYEEISGIERKVIELVPENAYREAIANVLIHRDWSVNAHIRIAMFPDRIEIKSPGGLPRGLSVEEYENGEISCLRNPILGNVFFRLRYIEMFGTGITRIKHAYANAKVKPKFSVTDHVISITLPIISKSYNVTDTEELIIRALEIRAPLSSSEIAKAVGFTKSKTLRVLEGLKEKGFVSILGNGRGTKYSL